METQANAWRKIQNRITIHPSDGRLERREVNANLNNIHFLLFGNIIDWKFGAQITVMCSCHLNSNDQLVCGVKSNWQYK